jgi:hypothetical protein
MLDGVIRLMFVSFLVVQLCQAAPSVIISEFMAENNGFVRDSFGNSSDWLELQNTTGHAINLNGWTLTDDASAPGKWVIPDVTLAPWGTLLVWASNANLRDPAGELHTNFALGKKGEYLGLYDASGTLVHDYAPTFPAQYENISYGVALSFVTNSAVLVSNTSPVRAFCPADNALGTTWRQTSFDDSAWASGIFPVGYGTKNPTWLSEVNFSLQSMAYGKPGVYLRTSFDIQDAGEVQSLSFGMSYDDGAAVFMNGTAACSANSPSFQTLSNTNYASSILGDPSTLAATNITAVTNALLCGTNVLSVHLMNCNATSSDLFLKPSLTAVLKTMIATNTPTFLISATPGTRNGDETTQRLPQTVIFSEPPGICNAAFTLTLSGNLTAQTIRYTTNGADPAITNSTLYAAPFGVSSSLHIRARVFDAMGRSGETATAQYTFCATDSATRAFSTSLPILVLRETDPVRIGIPTSESTNYTACSAHLIEPIGGTACLTSPPAFTSRAGIHIRGSSSSGFPKKPYALTFWGEDNDDKEVSISGFPEGSDFALISCWNYDRTYMHDAFLFTLSRQMGRYAPRTCWMEVFLVGNETNDLSSANYAGLYEFEERVKAGDDRIPIDDIASPADITQPNLSGSYIFKCDRGDADEYNWKTSRKYPGTAERNMVIAYPKLADLQPEQISYVVTSVQTLEDTLYTSDTMNPTNGVGTQIDLLSWVDFHIFNMFSMNVDAFTLSTFYHKDRSGKIMAGPLWDFDRSLGPYGYAESSFPNVKRWDAWTFSPNYFSGSAWWAKLHAQAAFRRLYWDRWAELRKSTFSETNLAATIAGLKAQLPEAAATRDYVKWSQWPTNDAFGRTHTGEVNWLTWFVTNHAAWIDQNQYAQSSLLKAAQLSPDSGTRPAGIWMRVTLTAPEGDQIRYTLDGTDPALWNNDISPSALTCTSGTTIAFSSSALLFARAYNTSNSRWGLAARSEYLIGGRYAQPGDLRLNEIHYHPAMDENVNHLPEHIARSYEFVEILNVADCDICLTGCRFPDGAPADALTLGAKILKPGEHVVVARSLEAFRDRYGSAVTPLSIWLYGGLSDSGETVTLLNRDGCILDTVTYKTSGKWPESADGDGDSLNRVTFSPAETQQWEAAVPTPGYGCYWEWFGLRGITSLSDDTDGDGVANLIEYYTGADPLDPTDGGRSNMQGVSIDEGGLCISYRQALDRSDVWASLQESDDLLEWQDIDSSYLSEEESGDGYLWSLHLSAEDVAAHPSRYFRLRVWPATSSTYGGTLPPVLP